MNEFYYHLSYDKLPDCKYNNEQLRVWILANLIDKGCISLKNPVKSTIVFSELVGEEQPEVNHWKKVVSYFGHYAKCCFSLVPNYTDDGKPVIIGHNEPQEDQIDFTIIVRHIKVRYAQYLDINKIPVSINYYR